MNDMIAVIAHKPCRVAADPVYRPVIVGTGDFTLENALRDNTGDNIAAKNPQYCELTALYWLWKNVAADYDRIGLCHYRRYFSKTALSNAPRHFVTGADLPRLTASCDIILPRPLYWGRHTVAEIYYVTGKGKKKDLDLTGEAIDALFPEYRAAFDAVLKRHSASYCNMFITSSERMSAYCAWLFAVLGYVEERIDMTGYSAQESRVFGYLSEILMNVWVEHNGLRVRYLPTVQTERTPREQRREALRAAYPLKPLIGRLIYGK